MIDLSLGAKRTETSEEKILKALDYLNCDEDGMEPHDYRSWGSATGAAIGDLQVYVPKLIEAYAACWQMSMELVAAWEQERAGITPTGLVIPK